MFSLIGLWKTFKERVKMSIVDIDKQGDTRANPSLNTDDGVQKRMAHNTIGNTYRTAGLGVTPRMRFLNGMIVTYDASDRISSVYGYVPELSDTPVLIIAKAGYDVFVDILGLTQPTK